MLVAEGSTFSVHTSLLFDPKSKSFQSDISLVIDSKSGFVKSTIRRSEPLSEHIAPPDVDLRGKTVLPGLVDAHTHIFLHAYSETPSLNQMRDESFVERVIRATIHCRKALMAGYTTYRDLGTEGAFDADIDLRNAINRGLIPGPRLYVATQTIASSGGYAIRQENALGGTVVPPIADYADGVDGVRAAVRRRLGVGADIVKFYADYRKRTLRFPPSQWPGAEPIDHIPAGEPKNHLLFNQEEMNEIVREATAAECPVAAHAGSSKAVSMAAKAGVRTIEHGNEADDDALKAMADAKTIFVPTLATMEVFLPRNGSFEKVLAQTLKAWKLGISLAAGGDTGAFPHGENVRELELMLEAGIPLEEVLTSATLIGWEACGGEWCGRQFGWLAPGCSADVIALSGDIREDHSALRKVEFVMKGGRVWKLDGKPIVD